MDAARNTRSTVKKLSSREQRIQTSPVKVDIEKGSLRIATETSNLETFPLPASILEFACIHSFPSLPFSFLSPRGKKKLAPLSSLSSNAYKTASPQERCSLERRIFDGGREVAGEVLFVRNSRFVPSCQREHFFFLLLLFLTGLVSLIYPVILEPRGTIRTFVRLPELVHPLDEKKERNKVLACSSFTAAYYKQGAGLGSGNIPRNIPSSFPYRRTNASDPPKTNRPVEKFHRFRNVLSFLVELYYFIV